MEFWKEVRRLVLTNELSKRGACEKYGLGWHTLMKIRPTNSFAATFPQAKRMRSCTQPTTRFAAFGISL
jgi:hypothetical protein